MKINKKIFAIIALVVIFVISATATLLIMKDKPQTDETSASVVETTTEEVTEETTVKETEAETTTKKVTTTAPTTVPATKPKAPISLNNTDKANFEKLMAHMLYFDCNYSLTFENYDCTSKDALNYALRKTLSPCYYTLLQFMDEELYEFGNYEVKNILGSANDPRDLWNYYQTTSKKYVEFILHNVFNIELADTEVFYDYNGNTLAYFEGNTCYINYDDGGDGAGPEVKIKSIETSSDGKYIISVNYSLRDPERIIEKYPDAKITAKIKEVEGKRLWSIYKIEMAYLPEPSPESIRVLDPDKEYIISYAPSKQGIARCSLPIGSSVIDYYPEGTYIDVFSDDVNNTSGFVYGIAKTPDWEYHGYFPKAYLEETGKTSPQEEGYRYICYNTPDHAGVNLRAEPSSSSKKICTINEGDFIDVVKPIERSGEYIKVEYNHHCAGELWTGWVLEKYIK